ncbi:MAG: hypothetical protein ACI80H_000416 [Pseudoalteromonas distincta]|jgi:hypothetical protein
MGKIGRIIYYSIVVLLIIIFVVVLLGDEYVGSGMGLGISIVLSVVAVLAILASSVMYLVDNPKSAISILIGIGVFLVVGVISYLLAPGTITEHHLNYGVESVGKSKLVDTGIYVTIFLSIVAVVSILASEAVSLIKN